MEFSVCRLVTRQKLSPENAWELGVQHRWTWIDEVEQSVDTPYQLLWSFDNGDTVRFIDDQQLDVQYFELKARQLKPFIKQLAMQINFFTAEELKTEILRISDPLEAKHLIHAAAIVAPATFDEALFRVFRTGITHHSSQVRVAVIWASAYIDWPQMKALVQQASYDSDAQVRTLARKMLDAYDKNRPEA